MISLEATLSSLTVFSCVFTPEAFIDSYLKLTRFYIERNTTLGLMDRTTEMTAPYIQRIIQRNTALAGNITAYLQVWIKLSKDNKTTREDQFMQTNQACIAINEMVMKARPMATLHGIWMQPMHS